MLGTANEFWLSLLLNKGNVERTEKSIEKPIETCIRKYFLVLFNVFFSPAHWWYSINKGTVFLFFFTRGVFSRVSYTNAFFVPNKDMAAADSYLFVYRSVNKEINYPEYPGQCMIIRPEAAMWTHSWVPETGTENAWFGLAFGTWYI